MSSRILRDPRTRRRRDQRGAAAVEFALVTPVFLVLVFGIIGFGFIFAQQMALINAARQAGRLAVVNNSTCTDIWNEVKTAANSLNMNGSSATFSVGVGSSYSAAQANQKCAGASSVVPCKDSVTGDNLYVTVRYTSRLIIPLAFGDPAFPLRSDGVFRCEFK